MNKSTLFILLAAGALIFSLTRGKTPTPGPGPAPLTGGFVQITQAVAAAPKTDVADLASFYAELANYLERDQGNLIKTTGIFASRHTAALRGFTQRAGFNLPPGLGPLIDDALNDGQINNNLEAENVPLTGPALSTLVQRLRKVAGSFKEGL